MHFNKISDHKIEFTDKFTDYNPGITWVVGSPFNGNTTAEYPDTLHEDTLKLNKTAKKSPALGFTFNQEPVKQEVALCVAVIEEYKDLLMNGFFQDSDYEKFLEKLKGAGSEVVIAEMQKQLDAWAK